MKLLLALLALLNLAAYLVWGMPPLPGAAPPPAVPVVTADTAQLQLLDERDGPVVTPAAGGEPVAGAPAVPRARPPAICYTFGSMPDRLLAERVQALLRTRGYTTTLRIEQRRGDLAGYWVLLPPQPSLGEAQARIDELRERGIDSFVVTEGSMSNAVSLGYFPGRASAEQLQRQLAGFGYEAQLVLRYAQKAVHWLDLDETGSERFNDAAWRGVSEAYPMLGRYVHDCG